MVRGPFAHRVKVEFPDDAAGPGFRGRPGWYNQGLTISKILFCPGSHCTMERTARLRFGDQTIELPVIEGSEGELGVDITSLRARPV